MKTIEMKVQRLGNNGWYDDGERLFCRASRWITIRTNYNPSPRNELWDYVTDEYGHRPYEDKFNPDNGLELMYFNWNGRNYAIEQFWSLGNPFYIPVTYSYEDKDGNVCFLSGVDMDGDMFHPIYIETDEYGTAVRVYYEI